MTNGFRKTLRFKDSYLKEKLEKIELIKAKEENRKPSTNRLINEILKTYVDCEMKKLEIQRKLREVMPKRAKKVALTGQVFLFIGFVSMIFYIVNKAPKDINDWSAFIYTDLAFLFFFTIIFFGFGLFLLGNVERFEYTNQQLTY